MSDKKYYTGIGSRETPKEICELMTRVAKYLDGLGFILRSGGADGADIAFELGAERKDIFLPWNGFNNVRVNQLHDATHCVPSAVFDNYPHAEMIMKMTHPAYENLSSGAKKLHTRNVYQVLGKNLLTPSEFVVLYATPTSDGVKGGTNTAYTIAKRLGIPCYNLCLENDLNKILSVIGEA